MTASHDHDRALLDAVAERGEGECKLFALLLKKPRFLANCFLRPEDWHEPAYREMFCWARCAWTLGFPLTITQLRCMQIEFEDEEPPTAMRMH